MPLLGNQTVLYFFVGSETSDSMECVVNIVPVVALYAGKPEMLEKVEAVIRHTQLCDIAVAGGLAAAR